MASRRKKTTTKKPDAPKPAAANAGENQAAEAPAAAGTPTGTPPVKIENFTREQRCTLSREELEERANRAAHLMGQRDLKEAEFTEDRKRQKSVLKQMDTEVRRLSNEVREKVTYREVPCERRYLYAEGKLVEKRCDTGEVIFERPLTEAEKQPDLPGFGGGGSPDLDEDFDESAGGDAD